VKPTVRGVPAPGPVTPADDDPGTYALDPAHVLSRLIAQWADVSPRRPFLEEVTGRSCDYADTWAAVSRWAAWLTGLGVRRGDRVISMLPASVDAVLLWLAAGCLGALEVPVDPALRGPFLEHVLRDSRARLGVVRPEFADLVRSAGVDGLRTVQVGSGSDPTRSLEPHPHLQHASPQDASCVIYTSGTTGMPKGVVMSWAQMAATVGRIPRSWLDESDAAYDCHPMFHVTGRSPLLSMADVGGRVVLRERFSASAFWSDVRAHGCTTTTTPTVLLLARPDSPDDADNPLRLVFGGNDRRASARFVQRFGVHVMAAYGSTEAGFPLVDRCPDFTVERCGLPRRGYELRVVDGSGAEVPDGTVGELWVRPPARPLVLLEYLDAPALTAAATAGGWYRTGDAVIRHDDGSFQFVDRLKDTIRRHGENISATAVEQVIGRDEDIRACAVLGAPDPVAGQAVVLVVVPRVKRLDPAALLERLRDQLPRHAVPSYVVVRDSLPRTPTDKIRRAELRESLDLDRAWRGPER
jgi:crotonobetaine/carnitine-CoA ligase